MKLPFNVSPLLDSAKKVLVQCGCNGDAPCHPSLILNNLQNLERSIQSGVLSLFSARSAAVEEENLQFSCVLTMVLDVLACAEEVLYAAYIPLTSCTAPLERVASVVTKVQGCIDFIQRGSYTPASYLKFLDRIGSKHSYNYKEADTPIRELIGYDKWVYSGN